jgi:hypothetical protein
MRSRAGGGLTAVGRRLARGIAIAFVLAAGSLAAQAYSSYAKWGSSEAVYYLNPQNADVSAAAAEGAVQVGADVWRSQSNASFRFVYGGRVSDTSIRFDNRNVVMFRNTSNGSTIATTYSWWMSSGELIDMDMIFWDGGFTFFAGGGCGGLNAAYIEDVAAHEFGHGLGLNHSADPNATMYGEYAICSMSPRTLAADDIAGVEALYPPTSGGGSPPPADPVSFTVEATTFAEGGQGCWQGPFYCGGGFYDETPGNWGDAQVRPGTDVDLWYDDGGIVIGGLDGLEWLAFLVNVPQSGQYRVTFRTASPSDRPSGSGVINIGIHGVDGSWMGNQHVPVTGGPGEWHSYVSWNSPTTIYLPAGQQTLTMWAAGGWYNVHTMRFTREQ